MSLCRSAGSWPLAANSWGRKRALLHNGLPAGTTNEPVVDWVLSRVWGGCDYSYWRRGRCVRCRLASVSQESGKNQPCQIFAHGAGQIAMARKTPKGDAVEKRQRGFSLIELMIAVVIISIMLAIALPNYQQHVISSKRAEAQAFLMDVAQREQQFLLDARRYASTLTELGVTQPSSIAKNYEAPTITVASAPPTFLITLKPTASGTQATDGDLTIDSAGTKSRAAPGGAVSW